MKRFVPPWDEQMRVDCLSGSFAETLVKQNHFLDDVLVWEPALMDFVVESAVRKWVSCPVDLIPGFWLNLLDEQLRICVPPRLRTRVSLQTSHYSPPLEDGWLRRSITLPTQSRKTNWIWLDVVVSQIDSSCSNMIINPSGMLIVMRFLFICVSLVALTLCFLRFSKTYVPVFSILGPCRNPFSLVVSFALWMPDRFGSLGFLCARLGQRKHS